MLDMWRSLRTVALAAILTSPSLLAQTALDHALDAVQISRIKADLHFLASDEMAGRDTPSKEQRIAARFLRTRLQHLGFDPGASPSRYLWNYEKTLHAVDPEGIGATWSDGTGEHSLEWGSDYFLARNYRGNRDLTGAVVYGGGFEEDQIEGVKLENQWVVLDPGTRLSRRRQVAAQDLGVHGFIIPAAAGGTSSVAESFEKSNISMLRQSFREPAATGRPTIHLNEVHSEGIVALCEGKSVGDELGATFRETWPVKSEPVVLENVCGLWPGSDPKLRGEVIILSAHYDHVGTSSDGTKIYNGADDNGSGTTGLLAVAQALEAYGPMRRTVMLIWVSGEEKGLYGSEAWCKDPWLPEGMTPLCNINIDMIGRNAADEIWMTPSKDHPAYNPLTQAVERRMGDEGFTKLRNADEYWRRSDQVNFSEHLGIPVAFLFTNIHDDYHQPTDTPDKINFDKLSRVVRLVVRMLDELQVDELDF